MTKMELIMMTKRIDMFGFLKQYAGLPGNIYIMFVARIIALHGTTAIAVQRVGTQVEAISYMTASGFGAALSAFVGQNLGANRPDRRQCRRRCGPFR